MPMHYAAIYRDRFGEETTSISNTGRTLRMRLRGSEFVGTMLDDWHVADNGQDHPELPFVFHHGDLCAFQLEFAMPITVIVAGEIGEGALAVFLTVGSPHPNGGVDSETLQLTLTTSHGTIQSPGTGGWFYDELRALQAALPASIALKMCFTCAFADYAPAGFGLFGCLGCFRTTKEEFRALKGKARYFILQDRMAGLVQETHLCPEYEPRSPAEDF
jgi:hypothetical protein